MAPCVMWWLRRVVCWCALKGLLTMLRYWSACLLNVERSMFSGCFVGWLSGYGLGGNVGVGRGFSSKYCCMARCPSLFVWCRIGVSVCISTLFGGLRRSWLRCVVAAWSLTCTGCENVLRTRRVSPCMSVRCVPRSWYSWLSSLRRCLRNDL